MLLFPVDTRGLTHSRYGIPLRHQVRSWCKSKKACGGARELYDHTTDPDEVSPNGG